MNQLITTDVKMTSLDIAEITGKMHKHVMADVRKEIADLGDEIGRTIFRPTERIDSQNRKQPIFEFGKDGAMQLALKYDAKTRYLVIKKIEELENKQKNLHKPSYMIDDPVKRAEKWIEEQKEKQVVEAENKR